MKYCVIGPTYPFRGGIAHYTTLLVQHLREAHDVRFISYQNQYPKWLYPGNTAMDPSPDASALRVLCDRVLSPTNPITWWKTYQIIKQEQPDALILQWWTPFWSPMLFFLTRMLHWRQPKQHILFLCHHLIAPDGGMFDWFLARRILWRGNALIVMSEEDFALTRRALPKANIRGTVLPPFDIFSGSPIPKDQARAKLSLPVDAPVVLFFGFVRHYKGLKHLIEALAKARQQKPNARLLIVGEFWEDERPYRQQIQQLGLSEHVHIYNQYIPNDDMATYFCAADVVALPYLEATQSGVAQLAIGFEVPMVSTSVGGMPEVVRHNETGLIVPPGDSDAFAAALLRYFDEGLSEPFAANIRTNKSSASWQPLVELIEELTVPVSAQTDQIGLKMTSPRML